MNSDPEPPTPSLPPHSFFSHRSLHYLSQPLESAVWQDGVGGGGGAGLLLTTSILGGWLVEVDIMATFSREKSRTCGLNFESNAIFSIDTFLL